MATDALETLKKSMAILEHRAAQEAKREHPKMSIISNCMQQASAIARTVCEVEDRRGLTKAAERPLDLGLLSNRQLSMLHKLLAIAGGEEVPAPYREPRKTRRMFDCEDLCAYLDALPRGHQLDHVEMSKLAGLISAVISDHVLPERIWREVYGSSTDSRVPPPASHEAVAAVETPDDVARIASNSLPGLHGKVVRLTPAQHQAFDHSSAPLARRSSATFPYGADDAGMPPRR
jgi:hypothetical protein